MIRPRAAALALALSLALPGLIRVGAAQAEAAPIFLDGTFGDWTGPVEHVDPAGDVAGGVDLRDLDLANDDGFLFLRFRTTIEIGIQADPTHLVLYLDSDANAATGIPVGGIGAELQWNFGPRSGCFHPAGGCITVDQADLRLRMLPSVTASHFEVAIGRDVRPDGVNLLFGLPTVRVLLLDSGSTDRAPDSGGLDYTFIDVRPAPEPAAIPFERVDGADVRVLTWNAPYLEDGTGFDPTVVPSADRVLSAVAPDILCLQEVYAPAAAQVKALVETLLPEGMPWYAAKQHDCVVVSRYPVLQSWILDGNLAVLLDTDAVLDADLLLFSAHLPCCTDDAGRQAEIDRIMAFLRDARGVGGAVTVPVGTGFLIAGDLNLVGEAQQLRTLLTGDIVDEATHGPDFLPDWDGNDLADLISSQTERRFAYTWRSDNSNFAPGRLDFLIHNLSAIGTRRHFIVYSPEMSDDQLAATGILAGDVPGVSDHLPHVADFRSRADLAQAGGGGSGDVALALEPALGHDEIRSTLVLGFAAGVEIGVFDAHGRRVRVLPASGALEPGRHVLLWDGRTDDGLAAPGGMYFARALARPVGPGGPRTASGKWVLLR